MLKYAAIILVAAYALAQAGDVPAYHAQPPAKGQSLPAVLTEAQLIQRGIDDPAVLAAYRAAARLPAAMYQQPCYCHCDRSQGHQSLHSCFEDLHGAGCGTCMQEALYTYQMSKKGWTAKQIREGIIRGEYSSISLQHPIPVN